MNRLAALSLLTLTASPALAVTAPTFVPGASPCAGACTLDGAAHAWDVPHGEPTPLVMPEGAMIEGMSWSRDGAPVYERTSMINGADQGGVGYRLPDGRTVFRVSACGNWSIYRTPHVAPPTRITTARAVPPVYAASIGRPGVGGGWWGLPGSPDAPVVVDLPSEPETPTVAPVPLPAGAALLICSLAALGLRGWRR